MRPGSSVTSQDRWPDWRRNSSAVSATCSGFALLPLLTFYLLADSNAVRSSALSFVPEEARADVVRLGDVVGRALGSYVRGQAVVCIVTGIAVGVALAATHHPAALLLGIVAGAAEVIPYVGFMVTAVTIVLAGLTSSPLQALLGLGIYVMLNWTIGSFRDPACHEPVSADAPVHRDGQRAGRCAAPGSSGCAAGAAEGRGSPGDHGGNGGNSSEPADPSAGRSREGVLALRFELEPVALATPLGTVLEAVPANVGLPG